MARTRSIKPSFFKNEFLAECEPMARLLFVGLWTLADRDGRLELRPMRIKAELFPYENCDIGGLLQQLADRGFVRAYESGDLRVLEITKFAEHQRCHPDEKAEGLPPPDESAETVVFPEGNAKPGNTAHEPGNPTAICALYPSSFNPSTSSLVAPSKPPKRRTSSKPADAIRWCVESGWEGITDADRAEWLQAYPAADLAVEIAKATQWLKANPKRAQKSNWRKWLTTVWLSKCQDRGGTHREPGRRPEDKPPPQVWRDQFRPAPYRRPHEVAEVAQALRLKEEET